MKEHSVPASPPTNVHSVELEPWDLDTLETLDGDPQTRGHLIFEEGPDGSGFGPGGFAVGVYHQQPCTTRYRLEQNETVHVLDGDISIDLDGEETVELRSGDLAVLPQGRLSTWTFRTPTRVLFVLSASPTADDTTADETTADETKESDR
jgi:uncharacterized protein